MKKLVLLSALLCLATLVSTAKTSKAVKNWKIWKTVTLGQQTKPVLIAKLKKEIGDVKTDGFEKIQISKNKKTLKLVLVTPRDLGFDNSLSIEKNYAKFIALAKKKGLQLCPQEAVLLACFGLQKTYVSGYSPSDIVFITQIMKYKFDGYSYNCLFKFGYGFDNGIKNNTLYLQPINRGGDYDSGIDGDEKFVFVQQ